MSVLNKQEAIFVELHELRHTKVQLEMQLESTKRRIKELQKERYNELCDYPIHPAFEVTDE